eukprot:CAMPEP_0183740068 /NCGR_PEP_ID=MMETSP0737-20130205/58762_1 /TAXON_ID=385413 /ORGANISM="Thalassiosira miniscula, Strain CCMP1093" /LENGTH=378 /DNA_ID=CAMNT_0025975053 /DNA_START=73 /DNA_END=1209 /DNA_ORIENTATION=-
MANNSNSNIVISCLSDDDGDDNISYNLRPSTRRSGSQKENIDNERRRGANNDDGDDDDDEDDEIEVVDKADSAKTTTAATTATAAASSNKDNGEDNDEELQMVGVSNEQKFPHSRQDCLEFRYCANAALNTRIGSGENSNNGNLNSKFCSLCYCYVCDKPAGECEDWYLGQRGAAGASSSSSSADDNAVANGENSKKSPHQNHCNASDKGNQSHLWKNMRKAIKEGRDPSTATNENSEETPGRSSMDALQAMIENYAAYMPASAGGGAIRRRVRHRISATERGGARQRRSFGGASMSSSTSSMYGSVTYAAAEAAASIPSPSRSRSTSSRSRSAVAATSGRRRARSTSGSGSSSRNRAAPHDHRRRIRTQQMLEDLYG